MILFLLCLFISSLLHFNAVSWEIPVENLFMAEIFLLPCAMDAQSGPIVWFLPGTEGKEQENGRRAALGAVESRMYVQAKIPRRCHAHMYRVDKARNVPLA